MPDESRKRKGVKSKMSTDNDYGTTSTVKNKKRMPTWLIILLILVLFAGGVLAGLKLATINEPTGLWARMFPEAVEPTMTAVPTATQKPSESAKPAAAAKPSAKPTESTKPTASAKPEESTAPAESAKPEASTKPEESAKPETSAAPTEATPEPSAPAAPEYIEPETAVDAALKHAKVSEKDADVYKARIEELRGTSVYIIGFTAGDANYEYEINALTGKVEGWERLRSGAAEDTVEAASASENSVTSSAASSNLPELIDVQAAKLTAYSHAGTAEKDAQSVKSALRLDGLKLVYEIQFSADKYAYDYTVDAVSGDIVSSAKNAK